MKRIVAEPGWGNLIIEDDDTGEVSLQGLSGGFTMYWHRMVLTTEEVAAFKDGRLDIDKMVREMNHGTEPRAARITAAHEIADLKKAQ